MIGRSQHPPWSPQGPCPHSYLLITGVSPELTSPRKTADSLPGGTLVWLLDFLRGLALRKRRDQCWKVAPGMNLADIENAVHQAWAEELKTGWPGPNSNFFLVGGNSLVAVRMMKRLSAMLGTAVPLQALFRHPTPVGLAGAIAAGQLPSPAQAAAPGTQAPPGPGDPQRPAAAVTEHGAVASSTRSTSTTDAPRASVTTRAEPSLPLRQPSAIKTEVPHALNVQILRAVVTSRAK